MDVLLNVELVKQLRKEKGYTVGDLNTHLGLSRTVGYMMFRKGLLPEDRQKRNQVLEKLATLLGREVPQILLSPEGTRRTA